MGASASSSKLGSKKNAPIPSSLAGGQLMLEAAEPSRSITKDRLDVVKDEKRIRLWMSCNPPHEVCRVLLLGKGSSGKSALINAIAGEEIAEESHVRQEGKGVEVYTLSVKDQYLFVVESPGLFDGSGREEGHLEDIRATVGSEGSRFHLVFYCHPITKHTFTEEDIEVVRLFTKILGDQLWQHAVIALTFVNNLKPTEEQLKERLDIVTSSIKEVFKKAGVSAAIAQHIPVAPVAFRPPAMPSSASKSQELYVLPDGSDWLYNLWEIICNRVSREAKEVLSFIETERFVPTGFVSVSLDHDAGIDQ